jgi:hypothetical protein
MSEDERLAIPREGRRVADGDLGDRALVELDRVLERTRRRRVDGRVDAEDRLSAG